MAHGDFIKPVPQEEAEEVIELMAEVPDEVYQSPARLPKRKAARLATKEHAEEIRLPPRAASLRLWESDVDG